MDWLANKSGVEADIFEALTAAETRPRSFINQQGLFLVLRGVNTNPGQDAEDMVSIRVWLERNRIITTRRRRLLSVKDLDEELARGVGPKTPAEFLTSLIDRMADRIGNFVDQIENRLGDIEDSLSGANGRAHRQRLGILRRQIAAVRRFLAPQRDALDRLYRQPGDLLVSQDVVNLREEIDRVARYLEDLDLARERSVMLQEELVAQLAQEQNTRMYVLSVVAGIFLPLTFVTGLLGMNVGGLPGIDSASGFNYAVAFMLVTGIILLLVFKWKKWV